MMPDRRSSGMLGRVRHTDWLLTASERANAQTSLDDRHPGDEAWSEGNLVRPLIHGATYFAELYERLEATRARRPGLLHRLAGRRRRAAHRRARQRGRRGAGPRRRARCRRTRADLALPHGDAELQRRARTACSAGSSSSAAPRRCSTCGCGMGGSHHQKLVVIRHRDDPEPRHRLRRRHRPVPLPPRRRRPPRRPAGARAWPRSTAPPRPGTTCMAAISGPAVHDVETVFRERWEDPTPLTRHPLYWTAGQAPADGHDARTRCPSRRHRRPRRTAPRTPSSCCAPTPTCGTAATTRSPAAASAASPAATPRRSSRPGAWSTSRTSTSGATTSATCSPRRCARTPTCT